MTHFLTTPIRAADLKPIRIGDIVYLSGQLVTCRDIAHRRLVEYQQVLPVSLRDGAVFHAGPIVRKHSNNHYEMVSIGPTTSMRMESFEESFVQQTGVRLIVGKGGMGAKTTSVCQATGAIHCVFPAGCGVLAANTIDQISDVFWQELGMPESLWVLQVQKFGPLIVSIDTHGENLFENNRKLFDKRKALQMDALCSLVKYIK